MNRRIFAALSAFLLIMGLTLSACEKKAGGAADILLSEVMAKNNGVLQDNEGDYPDWIELYNPTGHDISLKDYGLTDNAQKKGKFIFPDITVKAGEYFVVYASGKDTVDIAGRVVHLPFSINAEKEDVYLFSPHGDELGHAEVRGLGENLSCGPDGEGGTVWFSKPTPGAANADTYIPVAAAPSVPAAAVTVRINEYATKSSITLADEDGDFVSWVELHNYGDADVALAGASLSDDPAKPAKWTFPAATIPAGGYLVVYCSDKPKTWQAGQPLHADFTLSGKETSLLLSAADGAKVDECAVYELTANLSCGRVPNDTDNWKFFPKPTPGRENAGAGFDSIDSARYPKNKSVVVSEAAAVNRTGAAAADGIRYDYIELHNPTGQPVSLKGYRLSDNSDPGQWQPLPDITIAAGGYLRVFCSDEASAGVQRGDVFVRMGLSRYGEDLYLIAPDGLVADNIRTGRLDDGFSCGRVSDTDPAVYYFDRQTPGAANPSKGLKGPAPTPVFSMSSGYLDSGKAVTIACPGATIRYTTDGSEPTASSPVYKGAITVTKTVTIRARAFMDGRLPSDDSAGSYIVGRRHDMAVIFLSTDPANLFSEQTGILANGPGYREDQQIKLGANYWKDWERPVHFEYVDAGGAAQVEFNAGIKVFGQYSRELKQKSLSINLRDKYGPSEICFPFFDGGVTNVFSSLVLRSSGQDNAVAHIRDAYCAMAVKGQMNLDFMDYRPVVVYVNGEYFGIYDLRDKIDEDYAANRTGSDPDAIDMIKGNSIVMSGSIDEYKRLLSWLDTHPLTVQANYDAICAQVDIEELINYWIVESFFNNTDTGNIKFYKGRGDGSKWRWVLFDLDWALFPPTYKWNMVEEFINPKGHGVGKMFSSQLMCALMRNDAFRAQFLTAYGTHLKTTFEAGRLLALYDKMIAELEGEMPYHIERWGAPASVQTWKNNCAALRRIISEKPALTRQAVIDTFTCKTSQYAAAYRMTQAEVEQYLK